MSICKKCGARRCPVCKAVSQQQCCDGFEHWVELVGKKRAKRMRKRGEIR